MAADEFGNFHGYTPFACGGGGEPPPLSGEPSLFGVGNPKGEKAGGLPGGLIVYLYIYIYLVAIYIYIVASMYICIHKPIAANQKTGFRAETLLVADLGQPKGQRPKALRRLVLDPQRGVQEALLARAVRE